MSRSRRNNPIVGITTTDSEKFDKRNTNRRVRMAVKNAIANGDEALPEVREISDVYFFGKDGKQYLSDDPKNEKFLRK